MAIIKIKISFKFVNDFCSSLASFNDYPLPLIKSIYLSSIHVQAPAISDAWKKNVHRKCCMYHLSEINYIIGNDTADITLFQSLRLDVLRMTLTLMKSNTCYFGSHSACCH